MISTKLLKTFNHGVVGLKLSSKNTIHILRNSTINRSLFTATSTGSATTIASATATSITGSQFGQAKRKQKSINHPILHKVKGINAVNITKRSFASPPSKDDDNNNKTNSIDTQEEEEEVSKEESKHNEQPTNDDDNNDNDNDDDESKKVEEFVYNDGMDENTRTLLQNRHEGIIMNPNGLSQHVLPNENIVKTNSKTGDKRMVGLERSMGYFWDLKDLKDTNEKPILSNTKLIPIEKSKPFPSLEHNSEDDNGTLTSLANEEIISLPDFITKNNRAEDPSAEVTLVVTCYNEYGNKMLPSWTDPYEEYFSKDRNRIKIIWLSMNEGRILKMLRYFITNSSKKNVEDYRRQNYLLYFGDRPDFRDVVRMHNKKTAYAYLLDGLGRVRFAGSGKATEEDVERIISFTKELAPGLKASRGDKKGKK